jgi:hypothetical protein
LPFINVKLSTFVYILNKKRRSSYEKRLFINTI